MATDSNEHLCRRGCVLETAPVGGSSLVPECGLACVAHQLPDNMSCPRGRPCWRAACGNRAAKRHAVKTILPPEGKDAATTARCSSSAPSNSGTETSQAACGWPRISDGTAACWRAGHSSKPAVTEVCRRQPRKLEGWSVLRCGQRRSPFQWPCRREDAAHLVLPWIQRKFRSSLKGWARGVYRHGNCVWKAICRPVGMTCSSCGGFNRRRNPYTLKHSATLVPPRHQCRTSYLQHLVANSRNRSHVHKRCRRFRQRRPARPRRGAEAPPRNSRC